MIEEMEKLDNLSVEDLFNRATAAAGTAVERLKQINERDTEINPRLKEIPDPDYKSLKEDLTASYLKSYLREWHSIEHH